MKKRYKIIIDVEFGSDFQEESATTSLKAILLAWQKFYKQSHKKNKIEIGYDISREIQNKSQS